MTLTDGQLSVGSIPEPSQDLVTAPGFDGIGPGAAVNEHRVRGAPGQVRLLVPLGRAAGHNPTDNLGFGFDALIGMTERKRACLATLRATGSPAAPDQRQNNAPSLSPSTT